MNSESALVFPEPELAARLRQSFLLKDLGYSREATRERAAEFADPGDVAYRFRSSIWRLFEDWL